MVLSALVGSPALALDPIQSQSGFSGYVQPGLGFLSIKSNTVAKVLSFDLSEKRTSALDNYPDAENTVLVTVPFKIAYTFAGSKTELFLGTDIGDMLSFDTALLYDALSNLVINAQQAMPEGGELEIRTEVLDAKRVRLYVRDNGIGVAPEHHERIFGLFNKLDARSEGTGIGLALVKRIIEVHGGTIWVESELGKGATFFFTLEPKKQQENL